jgi:3'-phosphoadenosine 5'-phosphosulfate sulfotransferase (PAPS reductase)/FAD synthetase
MTDAISFGGGVNSVAMTILLVGEGWRGPIAFAETGCEWPETYSYMAMFERDWLAPRGLAITRVGAEWRPARYSRAPLLDYCEQIVAVPGHRNRWCTLDWKVRPLERWRQASSVDTLLVGIAADESHRARADMTCPLCERLVTRRGCMDIIAGAGLPIPPKSGCVMCFFQPVEQWRRLWQTHPEIFERVARLDDAILERKGYTILQDTRKRRCACARSQQDSRNRALCRAWTPAKLSTCAAGRA